MLSNMSAADVLEDFGLGGSMGARSHSAQGLSNHMSSPAMKIPLPPRMWITGNIRLYSWYLYKRVNSVRRRRIVFKRRFFNIRGHICGSW